MFDRIRLLQQVGFMFIVAFLSWLANANALCAVALTVAFLLLAIFQSMATRPLGTSAEQHEALKHLLNTSIPMRFSSEFLQDYEFAIAFVYLYTMSPEKLLCFTRFTVEARQSADQDMLKLVSKIVAIEKIVKRVIQP